MFNIPLWLSLDLLTGVIRQKESNFFSYIELQMQIGGHKKHFFFYKNKYSIMGYDYPNNKCMVLLKWQVYLVVKYYT